MGLPTPWMDGRRLAVGCTSAHEACSPHGYVRATLECTGSGQKGASAHPHEGRGSGSKNPLSRLS